MESDNFLFQNSDLIGHTKIIQCQNSIKKAKNETIILYNEHI